MIATSSFWTLFPPRFKSFYLFAEFHFTFVGETQRREGKKKRMSSHKAAFPGPQSTADSDNASLKLEKPCQDLSGRASVADFQR